MYLLMEVRHRHSFMRRTYTTHHTNTKTCVEYPNLNVYLSARSYTNTTNSNVEWFSEGTVPDRTSLFKTTSHQLQYILIKCYIFKPVVFVSATSCRCELCRFLVCFFGAASPRVKTESAPFAAFLTKVILFLYNLLI